MDGDYSSEMQLLSHSFNQGERIPDKYTCKGINVNPSLQFVNVPEGTRSLMLLVTDIDSKKVKNFAHFIVFDMPADTPGIREGMSPEKGKIAKNDFGDLKYEGPCPEEDEHRYVFTLYALDTVLMLESGASREEIESAMDGAVLDEASIMGTFCIHEKVSLSEESPKDNDLNQEPSGE
jgi:hypothetical protein